MNKWYMESYFEMYTFFYMLKSLCIQQRENLNLAKKFQHVMPIRFQFKLLRYSNLFIWVSDYHTIFRLLFLFLLALESTLILIKALFILYNCLQTLRYILKQQYWHIMEAHMLRCITISIDINLSPYSPTHLSINSSYFSYL